MREKKVGLTVFGVFVSILLTFGLTWAQNPPTLLVVVRASNDSLWKKTCDKVACSPFTSFPGMLGYQPTVAWDETAQQWVIVGTASNNSIWMAIFDERGNFNNDWHSLPGSTPSPPGVAGGPGPRKNPMEIALLCWDDANTAGNSFSVGTGPNGIAFDGANIWVANSGSNNVTKLRASDGANQGTFFVGDNPVGVAFDGANVWVTNINSNSVTKLRASDGATQGTFSVGNNPYAVAFDGANIWVANSGNNTVTKLRASDGATLGTFSVGNNPVGVAFDGANVWVTNFYSNSVSKL